MSKSVIDSLTDPVNFLFLCYAWLGLCGVLSHANQIVMKIFAPKKKVWHTWVWLTKVLGCIQPLFFKEKLQVINKKTKQALKFLLKLASTECMHQSELEFVVSKLTY